MLMIHKFDVAVIQIFDTFECKMIVLFFDSFDELMTETAKKPWIVAWDIREKPISSFQNLRCKSSTWPKIENVS